MPNLVTSSSAFFTDLHSPNGEPRNFNLAHYCVGRAAAATPHKKALIVVDDLDRAAPIETWTFGEIETAILRLGGLLLEAGGEPGDRLLIRLNNHSSYALLFFAAIAVGLVPIPASSQLSAREATFLLADSRARFVALDPALPMKTIPETVRTLTVDEIATALEGGPVAHYAQTGFHDPAFLVYTSGTTAEPKGVLHAQRSAYGRRPMYEGWYGLNSDDLMLHAGAFNWTYTLGTGLMDPWANGATTLVFTGDKVPAVWPVLMERFGATLFAAVPSLYRQILKYCDIEAFDLSRLRHGLTAGETLPIPVLEEWQARTGKPLYEALGMSEISTYISSGPSVQTRAGAVGRPQAGRNVAVLPVDGGQQPVESGVEGLLCVHRSDPGLMLGYWNRPDEEETVFRGDWFCGGDLAVMDEDGYVYHRGRANDLLNALGYRVSPFEIEQVLNRHEGVAESAAVEIEIKPNVRVIAGFIVPNDGHSLSEDQLRSFAEDKLASYKVPKVFKFVKSLPKTANGKLMRRGLVDLFDRNTIK